MTALIKLSCTLLMLMSMNALAESMMVVKDRPSDFVDAKKVIPAIQTDMRYFTDHNFVGRKIAGYDAPTCLLTQSATNALKKVEAHLLPMGLTLKVYDCYRPQTAVNEFAKWAEDLGDTKMRAEFYPTVDKTRLLSEGYIAYQSGHSRGSTMDLTIVPLGSQLPTVNALKMEVDCTAPAPQRSADNSLDFGTGYDCFSPVAHPDFQDIDAQEKANRLLLQTLMVQSGFKPFETEWWHFTLVNEPYPTTYFDFPVN